MKTGIMAKPTAFNVEEFDYAYPEGINNHYWNDARNKIILQSLKKHGMAGKPVLEIGCGRGGVVAFLKEKDIDIFGLELAPCPPFKEAEGHIQTGTDALEMDETFKARYKTLLLLDVIEHIEDPVSFVQRICAAYPNISQIIFTVPARQEIWSNYDEFYGHFRRYDLGMMSDFAQQCGFIVKENRYLFHLLYWPAKLLTRLGRDRNLKINPPQGMAKTAHTLLSSFFVTEQRLLPRSWKGSSVFCVVSVPHAG